MTADGLTYPDSVHSHVDLLFRRVPGKGPVLKKYAALGIETVGDLLAHYPWRYADSREVTDIASLTVGHNVSLVAQVRSAEIRHAQKTGKPRVEAKVTDGTRTLDLVIFMPHEAAAKFHLQRLVPGSLGLFSGQINLFNGRLQLANPTYAIFGHEVDEAVALEEAEWPIPIYPATAGLESDKIRAAVRSVLEPLTEQDVPDPVPDQVRVARHLASRWSALRGVHLPRTEDDWRKAQARLRYEEAFVLQAELARRRARAQREESTARPARPGGLLEAFDARLPFVLTEGQVAAGEQIAADLARPQPMQRLLQGEVGSGKTVVALRAMLQVVDAGGQAALLAPTSVLAAQHVRTLRALLGDLAEGGLLGGSEIGTRVAVLTGAQSAAERRSNLLEAASGQAGIVVGTHALLSDPVQFADLGLVVIDEQHKFGVEQRGRLQAKAAKTPHLLVTTATPIPRTVAMTVFGELEISELRHVPAGRSGVTTHVVPADNRAWMDRTWSRVREEVERGGRAFVVCARIDEDSDAGSRDGDGADLILDEPTTVGEAQAAAQRAPKRPLRAVLEVAETLRGDPRLGGVAVGLLHGRMTAEEKDRAIADFASGRTPVLVSTTVIEVGVDVPAATAIVILDAQVFGLSQLHQLRGRVGRGNAPGLCLLVADAPEGTVAAQRLGALAATTDGFELARVDLELRREGDVLGSAQSGRRGTLRFLRIVSDAAVIERAREDAQALVEADPELTAWPALRAAIDLQLADGREDFLGQS
ncbi:ATP-dependent DNA helicase RecG [Cellulomonas fengjieae]|uniref:ATP-dependent DNA helicase RecG n=1 Tax=Cellulomonas fengjieae TaxID=2819978 RepID=UPI001AAE35B5|nr:ATP-dependent DNA helicase RecG [Cellulomonas fengjieae]MBO3101333.1 ATP-dependent DNA helicase RecG [Cellulomonas fengjieae]